MFSGFLSTMCVQSVVFAVALFKPSHRVLSFFFPPPHRKVTYLSPGFYLSFHHSWLRMKAARLPLRVFLFDSRRKIIVRLFLRLALVQEAKVSKMSVLCVPLRPAANGNEKSCAFVTH